MGQYESRSMITNADMRQLVEWISRWSGFPLERQPASMVSPRGAGQYRHDDAKRDADRGVSRQQNADHKQRHDQRERIDTPAACQRRWQRTTVLTKSILFVTWFVLLVVAFWSGFLRLRTQRRGLFSDR
jgi:hypothetical protein